LRLVSPTLSRQVARGEIGMNTALLVNWCIRQS
jgi:hypothetical protein